MLWLAGTATLALGALVWSVAGQDEVVKPDGMNLVGDFFGAAVRPRLDGAFISLVLLSTVTTVSYAVLGTGLSLVIGLVGGVLCSQAWWSSGARSTRRRRAAGLTAFRLLLVVPRGIHEVIWGLILLAILGVDPLVPVLAIGIPFGAVTAKVSSELIDETGRRPYEALLAQGASRTSAMLYGLLPAATSELLSYGFYRFECAIRSATILGLVGAGGLGFQITLSFQTLQYDEIWTLLYAVIAISWAADRWSSTIRRRRQRPTRAGRDPVLTGSILLGCALPVFAIWWVGLDLAVALSPRAWAAAGDVFAAAWPPTLGSGGFSELVVEASITVIMSVLAGVIAFCGGALLAFPAARLSELGRARSGHPLAISLRVSLMLLARLALLVMRAIPPPIWALLFLFVLFPGVLPGAFALAIYTVGILGRLMAESAENLDGRPLRALRAHGASEVQVFCYAVVPAAAPRFIAYGLYRWEVTIRETVVVGVVGAGGLGLVLQQQLAGFDYGAALSTLTAMVVLTIAVDFLSAAMRRSLR
ncbi:ABC transporter permease [Amycolatopsis sp. TNS106]|uniref:PhnE/PtxC family ABC transporter permease n=1 Tax=Amycolatopsis sp. TNS106 TaxID=2861750 RepID=UPI001C562955|nr:ABC transporter permease subunit [Amycolatopsis sp. TNS106]QXV56963.1 ABC transporter permease [Amycolatopsis sp. TNS106]